MKRLYHVYNYFFGDAMDAKLLILAGVMAFSLNLDANALNLSKSLKPKVISVSSEDIAAANADSLYANILTQLVWIHIHDTSYYDTEFRYADDYEHSFRSQLHNTVKVILDTINDKDQYSILERHKKYFFYGNTKKSEPELLLEAFRDEVSQDDIVQFLEDAQKVLEGLEKMRHEAERRYIKQCAEPIIGTAEVGISRVKALIEIITSKNVNNTAKILTPALIVLGDKTLLVASNLCVRELEEILGRKLRE